jgi:hypothetical protein
MSDRKSSHLFLSFPICTRNRWRQLILASLLTGSFVLMNAANVLADMSCKPLLSFRNVREIRPASRLVGSWTWRASIAADTRYCATRSGGFEIDFIRIKEHSPDLQFTERLRWSAGQFDVSIELAADESILEYRLGFIAPCVCREFPDNE